MMEFTRIAPRSFHNALDPLKSICLASDHPLYADHKGGAWFEDENGIPYVLDWQGNKYGDGKEFFVGAQAKPCDLDAFERFMMSMHPYAKDPVVQLVSHRNVFAPPTYFVRDILDNGQFSISKIGEYEPEQFLVVDADDIEPKPRELVCPYCRQLPCDDQCGATSYYDVY